MNKTIWKQKRLKKEVDRWEGGGLHEPECQKYLLTTNLATHANDNTGTIVTFFHLQIMNNSITMCFCLNVVFMEMLFRDLDTSQMINPLT